MTQAQAERAAGWWVQWWTPDLPRIGFPGRGKASAALTEAREKFRQLLVAQLLPLKECILMTNYWPSDQLLEAARLTGLVFHVWSLPQKTRMCCRADGTIALEHGNTPACTIQLPPS